MLDDLRLMCIENKMHVLIHFLSDELSTFDWRPALVNSFSLPASLLWAAGRKRKKDVDYLRQGRSRGQVDVILSRELSHYWTWGTQSVTSTTTLQWNNWSSRVLWYLQESISLDRTCTETLCRFGASTVSRSCGDTGNITTLALFLVLLWITL